MLESLRPPLELVFAWQTSQFPHGIRRGWGIVILIGVLFPICLLAVVIRTRLRVRRRSFGVDDCLIIFAVLFAAGVDTCIILGFRLYGYDRHVWDITQPVALQARKIMLAIELLNSTSTCLTKVSILFFYRRLGRGTYTTTFLLVVQTNIVLIGAYLLSFSTVLLLTCHPLAAHWLQFSIVWTAHNTYRCLDEAATTVAANAVSIAQDLVACCLPAVLLWKLQMGRRKKLLLGSLLGLGVLPCAAGVLRLLYTVRVYESYDATWTAHTVLVWTVVENHVGILCACAPALHSYGKEVWRSCSSGGSSSSSSCGLLLSCWLCTTSTLSLFKYLGSRSTGGATSSSSSSFFRSGGKRRKRRSASGHVELEENIVGGKGGGSGGGRSGGGGGSSSDGSGIGSIGSGRFSRRAGANDDGGSGGRGSRGAETLLSSLSVLDEGGSERSIMVAGENGDNSDDQGAADDSDLERGRTDAGAWELGSLPEVLSPSELPRRVPPAYLGLDREQQRMHNRRASMPLSTTKSPMQEGHRSADDIALAITRDPIGSVLQYDRRNGNGGIERN